MDRLVSGYRAFRGGRWQTEHRRYVQLAADGQKPETLVIACSDSALGSSNDIRCESWRVVRRPQYCGHCAPARDRRDASRYHGGNRFRRVRPECSQHSGTGACAMQRRGCRHGQNDWSGRSIPDDRGSIFWHPRSSARDSAADGVAGLERDSVLLSMERLMTYPFIADRVRVGGLEINGARFGISDGVLEVFDRATATFLMI